MKREKIALSDKELTKAFNAVYRESDFKSCGASDRFRSAGRNWLTITLGKPDMRDIRSFLSAAGNNENWGLIHIENDRAAV